MISNGMVPLRQKYSAPLPAIQSETWLVHAKVREPHLNPPGSYELFWLFPSKQGREADSSHEPGGSDVVRKLSREPAMFQIGLQGEVLKYPGSILYFGA